MYNPDTTKNQSNLNTTKSALKKTKKPDVPRPKITFDFQKPQTGAIGTMFDNNDDSEDGTKSKKSRRKKKDRKSRRNNESSEFSDGVRTSKKSKKRKQNESHRSEDPSR